MPTDVRFKTKTQIEGCLNKYDWKIFDQDLAVFDFNDVVEIYRIPEFKQMYANDKFWELCSYSPEQMVSLPFDEIFFRPIEVSKRLQERVNHLIMNDKYAQPWDVPLHELVEIQHPLKRTFEMNLKMIAPIWDNQSERIVAIISSLTVNHIFSWPDRIF